MRLSAERTHLARRLFRVFDFDGSRCIDLGEFEALLQQMHKVCRSTEIC